MATRQILLDGAEALRKKCKEVETVNDRIRLLLDDMMDTLHHTENSAALAANQVGILRRLVVIGRLFSIRQKNCNTNAQEYIITIKQKHRTGQV